MKLLVIACLTLPAASACIPEHDYEGDYEMTYDVVLDDAYVAGETPVEVRHGLTDEYLVHLGPSFCLLEGRYVAAEDVDDQPYMQIAPQPCYFTRADKVIPLSVSGSATYTDGEDAFAVVLAGSYLGADGWPGTVTVDLTERR